jgi:uncharacterized protein YraI
MRRSIVFAAALAAGLALPAAANARPGFARTDLDVRAGPSFRFPVVDTIPGGARLNIHGCLRGYTWCDVSWRGERGWTRARELAFLYRGRRVLLPYYAEYADFPIIGFDIDTYWPRHYRHHRFYGRLRNWEDRHAGREHHDRFRTGTAIAPNRTQRTFGRSGRQQMTPGELVGRAAHGHEHARRQFTAPQMASPAGNAFHGPAFHNAPRAATTGGGPHFNGGGGGGHAHFGGGGGGGGHAHFGGGGGGHGGGGQTPAALAGKAPGQH